MRALSRLTGLILAIFAGTGVWLMIAPFTVGWQHRGGGWVPATETSLVTGAIVLGLSLITLAAYLALTLRARLREAPGPGPVPAQPSQPEPAAATAPPRPPGPPPAR
ncbi:MAG: hypothetical protein J2P34_09360 [Actinobacteria bacterium]|nr:hypothetical protein [Actinomycetota bacterium]